MLPATIRLLAHIPNGRNNAISRAALAARLGMTDRAMRRAIEDARADGAIIINTGDGNGYFTTNDIAEIRRKYWLEKHRMISLYRSSKTLRDILKRAGEKV